MKISACIEMLFPEKDFYDRIACAKECSIDAFEFWRWSNKDVDKLSSVSMNVSVFNVDSSDQALSDALARGIINDGRADELLDAIKESTPIYKRLNAQAMIVLIGDNAPYNKENCLKCLNAVKPYLEENNVSIVVEPLNDIDRKNYSMPYSLPVLELIREVDSPNIKMLYDIYHQAMMKDLDINVIRDNISLIGHFHVADAPGRHEPFTAELNYVDIIESINRLDYSGYIGLEYRPTKKTEETLAFLKEIKNA